MRHHHRHHHRGHHNRHISIFDFGNSVRRPIARATSPIGNIIGLFLFILFFIAVIVIAIVFGRKTNDMTDETKATNVENLYN